MVEILRCLNFFFFFLKHHQLIFNKNQFVQLLINKKIKIIFEINKKKNKQNTLKSINLQGQLKLFIYGWSIKCYIKV